MLGIPLCFCCMWVSNRCLWCGGRRGPFEGRGKALLSLSPQELPAGSALPEPQIHQPARMLYLPLLHLCPLSINGYTRLPWWLSGKEYTCQAGDMRSIPGLGRSPEEGNGNLHQSSCLENPTDRGAWKTTVHGVTKTRTQLSDWTTATRVCVCMYIYTCI